MTAVTDTDIQQLKDLITSGNATTQKQMAELALNTQQQIAELAFNTHQQITELTLNNQQQIADLAQEMRLGFSEVKGEIKEMKAELKGVHTEITDIKTNQRGQDNRFFGLLLFFLTVAIGISTKLAKLY